MATYNLVDERWIPCIMPDGRTQALGIEDSLTKAHEVKELLDASPLVTVALHRLLLAILHRNFGPSSLTKWQELWNKGRWDETTLASYFSKWRHRFFLLNDERPFYQCRYLDGAKKHPVAHLAPEFASGNNATLFDHNNDESFIPVSPEIAARYIVTSQAFALGGGVSDPFNFSDAPLTRGVSTIVLGSSLFETLALNLLVYNDQRPFEHSGDDLPVWEQDTLTPPDQEGSPIHGYLDYLTWQSRRIHLSFEEKMVTSCQIQQNLKLPKQQYSDPFKGYRKDTEKGLSPVAINPAKALWRNSHNLLQIASDEYKRPEIFNWLARIEEAHRSRKIKAAPSYNLMLTGLATDSGKAASIVLWRHERLPLPLKYLQGEESQHLLDKLQEALDLAEDMGKLLGSGFVAVGIKDKQGGGKTIYLRSPLWNLARLILFPDADPHKLNRNQKREIDDFVSSLSPARPYWASLGIAFSRFLVDLAEDAGADGTYGGKTLPVWAREVRQAARNAFDSATGSLDRTGRTLRAVSIAEAELGNRLYGALKEYLDNDWERR